MFFLWYNVQQERMKRLVFFFIVFACMAPCVSWSAVNVKKAAAVSTQKASGVESATSLLPSVIGLVGTVQQLNAQQQQLTAECAPTSSEIEFVNELVKEWARIGDSDANSLMMGVTECAPLTYKEFMTSADKNEACFVKYDAGQGYIWDGYPKASMAEICPVDGNKKNCKYVSNIYDVFGKISFGDADYTKREAQQVARLREKYQKCAPEKVSAAKRELYGGFLTQTLGNVGQTSGAAGTADVLNAVSSIGGSGNIGNISNALLPSLGQMLDK